MIDASIVETQAVLAKPSPRHAAMLTHTVDTTRDAALCGRVKPSSLAGRYSTNPDAPATCERCAALDPRTFITE